MYKVLRREDGKLVSCVVGQNTMYSLKEWKITYPVNRWKKAKIGKIILCKTLKDAKETLKIQQGHEIWRCQTKKVAEIKELAQLGNKNFKLFWENKPLDRWSKLLMVVSTYGADKIKLTKRVR